MLANGKENRPLDAARGAERAANLLVARADAEISRVKKTLALLALLLLCAPFTAAAADPPAKKKELVILLLIDALRADHVGAYGYARPTTPVIDGLAAQGTRYTRAYVNAPWTRPSTTSFLTGLNASRHRTQSAKTKLPPDVVTMAQRLREAGWYTAGFTANGNGGSLAGLERGFHEFEDPTRTYTKEARGKTYNGLPTGEFVVERVLGHLRESKADKEFLFIFLVDPHDPYGAPPELEKQFLGADFKGTIRRKALWETNNDYPADERFSLMAIYDAGIRYSDIAVGQLVQGLTDLGRWSDTTLFISADHGEGFGEHGFYLHAHHFWEEVIHVPLIAKGARFAPSVSERLTQAIDVTATILDHAGARFDDLPGTSLYAPAPQKPRAVSEYNEFGIRRQAILDGRYKVVWQRPALEDVYLREAKSKANFPSVSFDKDVVQVFDLKNDPQEKRDLSASMPVEAAALLQELKAFVEKSDSLATSAP